MGVFVNFSRKPEILQEVSDFNLKLLNMKDHLETLLRKKIRIEHEIKTLKVSIKRKQKHYTLNYKSSTKVNLESATSALFNLPYPNPYQGPLDRQIQESEEIFDSIVELLERFEE